MSVTDSITQARAQGASDDSIIAEILKQNPSKAIVFQQAKDKGANSTTILNEVLKQNQTTPSPQTSGSKIGGFLKSLVSAPATILARPVQAIAEFAGASPETVNRVTDKLTGGIVAPVPQNFSDVKKDVGRGVQTVALGMPGFASAGATLGLGNSLEQGNDLFSVQTALQTALGAAGGKVLGLVGKPIFNVAGKVVGEVTPQYLKDVISKGNQAILDFAAQHNIVPENISKAVGDAVNRVTTVTKDAIKSEYKGSIANDVVENLKNKAVGTFSGKTEAEILTTPESEVYKLSPPERKLYFDTKANEITAKSKFAEQQVKNDLTQSIAKTEQETATLRRQVDVASKDEAIALRPKVIKAFGEQSAQYRRLVQEELAPHADLPITAKEVGDFVDTKFSEDPMKAQAIKTKLGLKPDDAPNSETTVGKLYDRTKLLREDIGVSSKKGGRVYNPDEKLTDDAIHTITDIMKTKGVDLTGARQFWAQYAPVRDEIIAKLKPFNQVGTQTKTFANTLTRVAEGKDVNNEQFIKKVEELVGGSIGNDTKDTLTKLSATEKQALAKEVEAKLRIEEAKLLREVEEKNLSSKQFDIERLARKRALIKRALVTLGLIAGYSEARHIVPILP